MQRVAAGDLREAAQVVEQEDRRLLCLVGLGDRGREDLDELSLRSQNNAARARDEGRFDNELVAVAARPRDKETGQLIESDEIVTVDVQANANCDVAVDVYLLAPDGTIVASPAQFSARLAPTIENVGTLAVGALLALGLVVGVVRTVRRGQTANRGARVPALPAAAQPEEDAP